MSNKDSRRIVPVSAVAIIIFAVLVVFEVLVIGGLFGIKSSTVARIAPWAYEPFLRLVGEHPESAALQESSRSGEAPGTAEPSGISSVAGFNPEGLTLDLDTQPPADGEAVPEQEMPARQPPIMIPVESKQTNQTPARPKEVVPVG